MDLMKAGMNIVPLEAPLPSNLWGGSLASAA